MVANIGFAAPDRSISRPQASGLNINRLEHNNVEISDTHSCPVYLVFAIWAIFHNETRSDRANFAERLLDLLLGGGVANAFHNQGLDIRRHGDQSRRHPAVQLRRLE